MKKLKIYIFVGHFGSGKTEMAINFALKQAKAGEKVTILDIDIVNPFYRTSELRHVFAERGIALIAPNFAGTTTDVPSLSPAVGGVFDYEGGVVIFDVGGDGTGATALSRYKDSFERCGYEMLFVINTCRPLTSCAEDIGEYMMGIEKHSRLKISELVCNSNLSYETDISIILEGIKEVEKVTTLTGIPLKYINVPNELVQELPSQYQARAFPLELFMTKWNN